MIRSLQPMRLICAALQSETDSQLPRLRAARESDWQAAIALANAHFVGPALWGSMAQTRRLAEIPDDVRAYLELLHTSNARRNRRLRSQALELISALGTIGADALLLKGAAALLLDPAAESSGRMIRDIDLLVPRGSAEKVFAVLRALSYEVIERYPAGHHAYGDFARPGDPAAVDLHFEIIDTPHVLPAHDVWRRATTLDVDGTRVFLPSPTDRMLHNVLHAQVHYLGNHYRGVIELRQLHEFATLVRCHGAAIDWRFIVDHLRRHHLRAPLHAYAWAAHCLLAVPWPLPESPALVARVHVRRCLLQWRVPALACLRVPLANLRLAFAPHRMDGLYPRRSPLLLQRLEHAVRFLRKGNASDWFARLLRSETHPRGWRR